LIIKWYPERGSNPHFLRNQILSLVPVVDSQRVTNQQCQKIWGFGANGKTEEGMKHPNLLFVFPDQMRGQAMGFERIYQLRLEVSATPELSRTKNRTDRNPSFVCMPAQRV